MTGHPLKSEPLGRALSDERRMERAPQTDAKARAETGAPTYSPRWEDAIAPYGDQGEPIASRAEMLWVGYDAGHSDRPAYTVRGKFVSGQTFFVSDEVVAQLIDREQPAQRWPRWYSAAAFTLISLATLVAMCALGRPGA